MKRYRGYGAFSVSRLMGRKILLVSRIAKTPSEYFPYLSGGSKVGEQVITFKRQRKKVLVRRKSYTSVAPDSLPISQSVQANNYEPVLAAFDIQALSKDSAEGAIEQAQSLQGGFVQEIMDSDRMLRLVEAEAFHGGESYTLPEMLEDLREGLWAEIYSGTPINTYRRNVQRSCLEAIKAILDPNSEGYEKVTQSDIQPLLKQTLRTLANDIEDARISDATSRAHLEDAEDRIDAILDMES